MLEQTRNTLRRLWSDISRSIVFAFFGFVLIALSKGLALITDQSILAPILVNMGAVLICGGITTHIVRRALLPYIDLSAFAKKALEEPLAASVIFLSVSLILCTVLTVSKL